MAAADFSLCVFPNFPNINCLLMDCETLPRLLMLLPPWQILQQDLL
jgi:hypothetical protein